MQPVTCTHPALAIHRDINRTARAYPRDSSVPERFEHWAKHRPDSTAVIQGDRQLSYRQLNAYANGLARDLREEGAVALAV